MSHKITIIMEIKIDNCWHHYHHLTKPISQELLDVVFIKDFSDNTSFQIAPGLPGDPTVITKKLISNDNLKHVNNLGHIYWSQLSNFLNHVCICENLDFLTVSFNWMGNCFGLMWYDRENLESVFGIQDVRMIYFWGLDD